MLVALLNDVVPDLLVPVGVPLQHGVEHVGEHEALRGNRRHVVLWRVGRHRRRSRHVQRVSRRLRNLQAWTQEQQHTLKY